MAAFFHTADVKDKVQERGKTFTQKKRILAALIVVRVRDYHLYLSGRVDGSASLLCQKGVHCLVVVVTVTVTGRKTLLLFLLQLCARRHDGPATRDRAGNARHGSYEYE